MSKNSFKTGHLRNEQIQNHNQNAKYNLETDGEAP